MKHTVQRLEGCTLDGSLIINGIPLDRLPEAALEEFTADLFDKLRESVKSGALPLEILIDTLNSDSVEWDHEPCGSCGDCVTTTTWIL